jgi:two-component system LytT family response regulator
MYTALIVDDEQDGRTSLRKMLELYCPQFTKVYDARDGKEAMAVLESYKVDLVFLDIQLKKESGLELSGRVKKYCKKIIYVTAYDEYAVKAFQTKVVHYLLKPVEPALLEQAVEYAELPKGGGQVEVSTLEETAVLQFDEILYLEGEGNYSNFYTVDGRHFFTSKGVKHYEENILPNYFQRPHQSYLVNMKHVRKVLTSNKRVILANDISIPSSKRKFPGFIIALKTNKATLSSIKK